jgi:hypothetical protein
LKFLARIYFSIQDKVQIRETYPVPHGGNGNKDPSEIFPIKKIKIVSQDS